MLRNEKMINRWSRGWISRFFFWIGSGWKFKFCADF